MEELLVLQPENDAVNLTKIANLLGVQCRAVDTPPTERSCLIVSGRDYDRFAAELESQQHVVLVYGAGLAASLASRFPTHIQSADRIVVSESDRNVTGPLTGLTLETPATEDVFTAAGDWTPLIAIGDYPLLLKKENTLLLATTGVVDIDTVIRIPDDPHRVFFSSLIPFVLFIKWALKDSCWRLNRYGACITIDDPLLHPHYGNVDFEAFHAWLKRKQLAATFAFIPWNYNRSDPSVAELFRQNPSRLSICVHGCDHTRFEFATDDTEELTRLATTALARMESHRQTYDLEYDPIMVYPQGRFSDEARRVLSETGFIADVAGTALSTDANCRRPIRDLLDGAIPCGKDFALYTRRYPNDVFDFACDLLFEKPLIITQHQNDFADGFTKLEQFTDRLREVEPRLVWMPLGRLVAGNYWRKTEADGTVRMRHFAPELPDAPLGDPDALTVGDPPYRLKVAMRRYLSELRDNLPYFRRR